MLQAETGSLSGVDHSWFNRNIGEERSVTRDSSSSNNIIMIMIIIIIITVIIKKEHAYQ